MARGSACLLVLAIVLLAVLAGASSGGAAASSQSSPFAGLGTWIDIYSAEWADPEAAVAAMAQHHVRTLYLETGNYSHTGPVFKPRYASRFIDAAHAAGLKVVAWYLPSFTKIGRDERKALGAIHFQSATGQHFDGFALDIEATKVRSLSLRNHRLHQLSSRIRYAVGSTYPLGAITPSPVGMSPSYWPEIPYSTLSHYYKAFLPMAYFTLRGIHSRSGTRAFVAATVSDIRDASGRPNFPIHMIGGLSGSMGRKATGGFMRAVTQTQIAGYSLYAFGQTTPAAWRALSRHS
ncbi:MAG TPA: hypothetical protein VGH79_12225 [Gaiellaceae bacterium]|jgi:hypothetical protein